MLVVIAALFFIGIISISYHQVGFSSFVFIGFLFLFMTNKEKRFITSLLFSFLISFVIFIVSNHFIDTLTISKEFKIIVNRLLLIVILIGISFHLLLYKKKVSWYHARPDWKNPIILPFHKINIFWFWIIGIVVNGMVYLYFIVQKDVDYIASLFWFCLFFSLINAVFEEVIWRGVMLSAINENTSRWFAILITSVGFGLLHLAIGFSIPLSLLISVAGVIYAIITLKTNSIYPSIIFHFIINIGMVYSGFII